MPNPLASGNSKAIIFSKWDNLCKPLSRAPRARIKCHVSLIQEEGVHPQIVQERLGHGSIQITLDTYSHVAPGLPQAAANKFDDILLPK